MFGAALLKDETEDTFRRLFTEFISVMGNNHPKTIITDQCVAMGNAIKAVLPFTIHRYCNFHVGKKMKEKLVTFFAARGQLHELLRAVIRNSFTAEEFESSWLSLLNKYNAEGEAHLERIFEIRAQWVPAYFMDNFFPFTSSTGRSESTNSLFKHYVKRKDSISAFFKQYLIIQEKKQADLDRLREKTEFKETANWEYNPLEREAAKIYTAPIYAKFAEEMKKTTAYNVVDVVPGVKYSVLRLGYYWNAEYPRIEYIVDISADGNVHAIEMSKVSHMLSSVCTDDRSYDLFGTGVAELKKRILDDRMQRLRDKETNLRKRRAVDDPVERQAQTAENNGSSTKFNGDLNQEPSFEQNTADKELEDNADEMIYKDPPQTTSQGFNMGERPKSHYEQAALKKQKKTRKCGLCRIEGHRRPDCPDRDKV
ncbi:unnamed protein product [Alopecurus aequalis]